MQLLIIDDQTEEREKITSLLATYAPNAEVIGEADSVQSGLQALQSLNPELVLLDIELGDGTGFDFLKLSKDLSYKVIFITSHDEHALKAFRYSAVDYLLKPVDVTELLEALNKAKEQTPHLHSEVPVHTLLQNQSLAEDRKKLVLSDTKHVYLIDRDEIIRCESIGNYTRFFLTENRDILIAKTLKTYHGILDQKQFFRPHRSHLINLNHFSKLEKTDGGVVFMKDGSTLPIAVRRKDKLLEALQKL